jgi:ADP-ribosylglycohydrolase
MLGAIAGDIIGSVFESSYEKPEYNFPLFTDDSHFTDDTVLTVALADSIMNNIDYEIKLKQYYHSYPYCPYGGNFHRWGRGLIKGPYNSWGNGSAMRVSPVGWAYNDLETVLIKAKESAEVTHNHPEGIKGAQATALAIYLSRIGKDKKEIKEEIENRFGYHLDFDLEDLRKNYSFDVSCQGTVPQAIFTFLVSDSFEDSIRKAIFIGGDSDTLACINGAIAEAYYKDIPEKIKEDVVKRLDQKLIEVLTKFKNSYLKY